MSYKRKGQLTSSPEWVKYLWKELKRNFWRRERLAEKKEIANEMLEL